MLRQHLHFDTVKVYIKNRRCYSFIKGKCIYLDTKNKCTIYKKRSDTCRDPMPPGYKHYKKWCTKIISPPVELDKYLNENNKKNCHMIKYFKIIFLLYVTLNATGCTLPPYLKTNPASSRPEQILKQDSKWTFVEKISNEHPNTMRVLMLHTMDMGEALAIMKGNLRKYSTEYLRALPYGTSIYISKDNEMLINKKGGAAPNKGAANYKRPYPHKKTSLPSYTPVKDTSVNISEIKEEDLTE